ncbi:MAG TPA: hypothetical protein VKS24_23860 [Bradyrhizobium sp.]|nr:hypothetical protein [Bradyrhizobium sp.]
MGNRGEGYNYDRYRRLLAEATNEQKRLAFIDLLIQEKAKDRLAEQQLRGQLSGLGLQTGASLARTGFSTEKALHRKSP